MSITVKTEGTTHTIRVSGRLDFNSQGEFRSAYEQAAGNSEFILDLSATEYLDSSALGMLLLLRDYAGGDKAIVTIRSCRPEVKSILDIANFEKLFEIS